MSGGLYTGVKASVNEDEVRRRRRTSDGFESTKATRLGDEGDPWLLGAIPTKAQTWIRVGVMNGEISWPSLIYKE